MADGAESLFQTLRATVSGDELTRYCRDVLGPLERLHFDYKEKHDRRGPDLHDDDKVNVAKAVSGFANSAGGVLIWGVADDGATSKPISNTAQFMKNVLCLAQGCVTPKPLGIDAACVPHDPASPGDGYGLLYVPASDLPPHQAILKAGGVQGLYFARTGDSFVKADHYQLADMFGRRPKPLLELSSSAIDWTDREHWRLRFELANKGRGSARSPVLVIDLDNRVIAGGAITDNVYGLPSTMFRPGGEVRKWAWRVIHPGMSEIVDGLRLVERSRCVGPSVTVHYKVFAEDGAPVEGGLEFLFPPPKT